MHVGSGQPDLGGALLAFFPVSGPDTRVVRPPATTHGEFARRASEFLASRPDTRAMAEIPNRVVDVFHRIRFGHETVVPEQEAELFAAVSDLEARMNGANGTGARHSADRTSR